MFGNSGFNDNAYKDPRRSILPHKRPFLRLRLLTGLELRRIIVLPAFLNALNRMNDV
jgi:hypothetical protein